jgi:hypothetical protein
MSAVDRAFADYVRDHRKVGADPAAYLEQLDATGRRELAALIDGYLVRQPRREFDPEAFDNSNARPLADALHRSLHGRAGIWPAVLPQLRSQAGLNEEAVAGRLADALGMVDKRDKIASYYEAMESGHLPAEGVDDRVLAALAELLGTSAAALRDAGSPLVAHEARPRATGAPPGDDVDRLFRGRRPVKGPPDA